MPLDRVGSPAVTVCCLGPPPRPVAHSAHSRGPNACVDLEADARWAAGPGGLPDQGKSGTGLWSTLLKVPDQPRHPRPAFPDGAHPASVGMSGADWTAGWRGGHWPPGCRGLVPPPPAPIGSPRQSLLRGAPVPAPLLSLNSREISSFPPSSRSLKLHKNLNPLSTPARSDTE